MRRRADPARSKVDLPRIGFRIGDELGDVVSWDRQVYLHHVSQSHRPGNRDAVADEVEGKPFVERRVDGVVRAEEDDSVTIWRSFQLPTFRPVSLPTRFCEFLSRMNRL